MFWGIKAGDMISSPPLKMSSRDLVAFEEGSSDVKPVLREAAQTLYRKDR